jgi:putative redox protein
MTIVEARVTWIEDRRFVGQASSGHGIVVDASPNKLGCSPMELVLIGLAGCTAYDVISVLQKKRQNVDRLQVEVKGERAETSPRVYTDLHIEYIISGRDVSAKAVRSAISLSKDKLCSVSAMLEGTAKITTDFRITEEG